MILEEISSLLQLNFMSDKRNIKLNHTSYEMKTVK